MSALGNSLCTPAILVPGIGGYGVGPPREVGIVSAYSYPENGVAAVATAQGAGGIPPYFYALTPDPDMARFSIGIASGILTWNSSPDFEAPTDVGTNNVYNITVATYDSRLSNNFVALTAVAITVTDVIGA